MSENTTCVRREIIEDNKVVDVVVVIRTKITNALLASTLLASTLVGIEMLATDSYLWSTAPTHAIGLLTFTALALVLGIGVLRLPLQYARFTKYAFLGAALLAGVQLALMIGDPILGAPNGISQDSFRAYLLGNPAFVTLLGIQPIVGLTALAATRTLSIADKRVENARARLRVEVPVATD